MNAFKTNYRLIVKMFVDRIFNVSLSKFVKVVLTFYIDCDSIFFSLRYQLLKGNLARGTVTMTHLKVIGQYFIQL